MPEPPFVSVIVPVRNSEREIEDCVVSLLGQDYPSFEVIVVDNDSQDKTASVVSHYPVELVLEVKPGAYAARNRGVRHARGEIVAFTDSDCIADKQWLSSLVSGYSRAKIAGVGGRVLPSPPRSLVQTFLSLGQLQIFQSNTRVMITKRKNCFLCGALGSGNMSFRKQVLEKLGGFSEDLDACGDYEFSWRVQTAGYDLAYEPNAIVHHKLRSTIPQLVRLFFRYGKAQPMLLSKEPGGCSYIDVKSYLLPRFEFRCELPVRMLLTIDFINAAAFCLFLAFAHPSFFLILCALYLGSLWYSLCKAKETVGLRHMRFLPFLPILHLVSYYSLTAGRIVGGLKARVVSF